MATRRVSNGRSPLVNQQRQITSFFTKKTSELSPSSASNPSPSHSLSKQNPSRNPSTSPTTPSPFQAKSKTKKPILVIGTPSTSPTTPGTSERLYGPEVVDKRIKVYWPLDKCWYEGCVKYFDKVTGEHLVQYDDGEEESLNLSEEKVEWPVEEPPKRLRRLRKFSVLEDGEEEEKLETVLDDDSADEDWGRNTENETIEDVSEDMDLDDEVSDDEVCAGKSSTNRKKRKVSGSFKLISNSGKKSKKAEDNKINMDKHSLGVAEGTSTASVANDLNGDC